MQPVLHARDVIGAAGSGDVLAVLPGSGDQALYGVEQSRAERRELVVRFLRQRQRSSGAGHLITARGVNSWAGFGQ